MGHQLLLLLSQCRLRIFILLMPNSAILWPKIAQPRFYLTHNIHSLLARSKIPLDLIDMLFREVQWERRWILRFADGREVFPLFL